MIKSLCGAIGLAILLSGSAFCADEPAKASPIVSINISAGPGLFGGQSFFIDTHGNAAYQTVTPTHAPRGAAQYADNRWVADGRQKDFEKFAKAISPQDLLTFKPHKQFGIPDELRERIEIVLENGTSIVAWKWQTDDIAELAPLIKCRDEFVKTELSKITPKVVDFNSANFNNTKVILEALKKPAKPISIPID